MLCLDGLNIKVTKTKQNNTEIPETTEFTRCAEQEGVRQLSGDKQVLHATKAA